MLHNPHTRKTHCNSQWLTVEPPPNMDKCAISLCSVITVHRGERGGGGVSLEKGAFWKASSSFPLTREQRNIFGVVYVVYNKNLWGCVYCTV